MKRRGCKWGWGFSRAVLWRLLFSCLLLLSAAGVRADQVAVRVLGVAPQIEQAIRSRLSIERERGHALLGPLRVQRLHRRASDEIRQALQPFGYYSASISASLDRTGEETWQATYRVDTGPPVKVSDVDIRITGPGARDPALTRWRQDFPLRPGDVLRHGPYEEAKSGLLRVLRERGYLDAELERHEIGVRVADLSARIDLAVRTGPRYRFGEVTFNEVPLRESFLERFVPFEPGEPYDAEKIFQLQRNLIDSDYFQRADVAPKTGEATAQEVPVGVELTMRPKSRYTAGVGYATDTGPRITLGLERRWANGRGHRYGIDAMLSKVRNTVTARYTIPLQRPMTDSIGLLAQREQKDTGAVSRETDTLAASVTHQLGKWRRIIGVNYDTERYRVGSHPEQHSTMIYPHVGVHRIRARERIVPLRGWRLDADLKLASEDYGSSTSLAQLELRGKDIRPLLGGRLLTRADIGFSEVSNFDKLPVSLRFFAGGDQSVRGFAYESLGPTDEEGTVTGGKYLVVGSVEYDRYFTERTGAAVFVDTGNALNSLKDISLERGIGVGARWRLPFGVIRLDLALAESREKPSYRLHLSIGPEL